MANAGGEQHLFLCLDHAPQAPGTSVLCISLCDRSGLPSPQHGGKQHHASKGCYGSLDTDRGLYVFPGSCPASTAGPSSIASCFSAESITLPQAANSSAPKYLKQAPWEGAANTPAIPPSKLPLCLESGCPYVMGSADKPQLLCVRAGSFQQCEPTQLDLGQLSGVLWLCSSIPQSPWMCRCPYWS